jgi:tetratricopeptide (TPR) repeat protein
LGTSPLPNLAIPATLHASLIARLDRLGPVAKEVAQIGAVIGREFAYELIAPVAQRPEKQLQAALDQLGDAGLLFCRGMAPHASYLFKHALVQDAAYSTLLRGRRQELHAGVAAALEGHFADLVERQPELLAHHLTAAGDTERAVDQWLKAGRYAAARLAYLEAIAHFEQGLGLLHSLPESPVRNGREIELQLALGLCLFTAKGAVAAKPPYARAHELAKTSGEPQQRFEALYGVWQSTMVSGGLAAARPLSERLLRLAEREGDDELRLQAHHSGWSTLVYVGDPAKAREHADAGRRLYDPEKHASHRFVYGGHDPGVCAAYIGAQAEWLLGYPEKALASITESLALSERIAHPFTLSVALTISSVVYLNRREPERALRQLEAAESLAAEQRLSLIVDAGMLRGAALAEQGAVDEAIARIREGVTKWTRLGRTFLLPYGLAFWPRSWSGTVIRRRHWPHCARVWHWQRSQASIIGMRNYTALPGPCCSPKTSSTRVQPPFITQSTLRKPNKRDRWNCAPPPALHAYGATRTRCSKRANCSLRSTAGSPRGSIRSI